MTEGLKFKITSAEVRRLLQEGLDSLRATADQIRADEEKQRQAAELLGNCYHDSTERDLADTKRKAMSLQFALDHLADEEEFLLDMKGASDLMNAVRNVKEYDPFD